MNKCNNILFLFEKKEIGEGNRENVGEVWGQAISTGASSVSYRYNFQVFFIVFFFFLSRLHIYNNHEMRAHCLHYSRP